MSNRKIKKKPAEKVAADSPAPASKSKMVAVNQMTNSDVLNIAYNHIDEKIIPLKRDIQDGRILVKSLRNMINSLNTEFKALGMALGQLGIVEVNILNKVKNDLYSKMSVVDPSGRITGRNDVKHYNITPDRKTNS